MKKKTIPFTALLCLIFLGAVCAFPASAAPSGHMEAAVSQNCADPDIYRIYEPFGLSIDAVSGKLYYNNKLVRCFDDRISTKNFRVKAIGYYEKDGIIDVRAIRENQKGADTLTGLEVLSEAEFRERGINAPSLTSVSDGNHMFDVYTEYGLSYDESQKALFYDGKRVRLFWDSRNRDARPSESGIFLLNTVSNYDSDGEIDLYAVRDHKQADSDGHGKLEGLRIAPQEEFERNTKNDIEYTEFSAD